MTAGGIIPGELLPYLSKKKNMSGRGEERTQRVRATKPQPLSSMTFSTLPHYMALASSLYRLTTRQSWVPHSRACRVDSIIHQTVLRMALKVGVVIWPYQGANGYNTIRELIGGIRAAIASLSGVTVFPQYTVTAPLHATTAIPLGFWGEGWTGGDSWATGPRVEPGLARCAPPQG